MIDLKKLYALTIAILVGILGVVVLEHLSFSPTSIIIDLMGSTISRDGEINDPWKKYILIELTAVWLICMCVYCWSNYPSWSKLPTVKPLVLHIFCGLVIIIFFADMLRVYSLPLIFFDEDGVFEWFTAGCLLVSGILMLCNAWRLKYALASKAIIGLCVLGGLGILFVGMEEISWGQRVVGWETTGIFAEHNDQQETNFHNLYDETFWLPIAMMIISTLVILSSSTWLKRTVSAISEDIALLLPPRGQFTYIAIMLVLMVNFNEMFEVLFGAFIISYCFMIWQQSTAWVSGKSRHLHNASARHTTTT